MKLEINKSKPKMVGVRLSEESYKKVYQLAKKEDVSISEISKALIEAALKQLSK